MAEVLFNDWVKLGVPQRPDEPHVERDVVKIAAPAHLEWLKPGMRLEEMLRDEEDVLLLSENYTGGCVSLVVLMKGPNQELSYRIFETERNIRNEFSGLDLDLRIMTYDAEMNIQALIESSRVYLNRVK